MELLLHLKSALLSRLAIRFCTTLTAAATAIAHAVCVHIVVRMPLRAMSFGGISCSKRLSAKEIHPVGDHLQMSRIDAAADPAQVVNGHTVSNFPNGQLVTHTMSWHKMAVRHGEMPVSGSGVDDSLPRPASVLAARLVNLLPEAFLNRANWLKAGRAIPLKALPMHQADSVAMRVSSAFVNSAIALGFRHELIIADGTV